MMNTTTISYVFAACLGVVWILFFIANIKRIIAFAIKTSVNIVVAVISWTFVLISLVLFIGAIWFTIAPMFYPSITVPFSTKHIVGMTIDWSLALLAVALSGTTYVTDVFQRLLVGHGVEELAWDVGADFSNDRASANIDAPPRGAAGAGGRGNPVRATQPVDSDGARRRELPEPQNAQTALPLMGPEFIEREIPDSWVS